MNEINIHTISINGITPPIPASVGVVRNTEAADCLGIEDDDVVEISHCIVTSISGKLITKYTSGS